MDVAEIAGKLDTRQKLALCEATDGFVALKYGVPAVIGRFAELGLVPPRMRGQEQDSRLTKLGLAVRAHLQGTLPNPVPSSCAEVGR
jgi:hypothetical protein